MDINSLLESKKNIFDHVLYEFEMYYYSYKNLILINSISEEECSDRWFLKNAIYESHSVHLRNLLHFFSARDSININTVLANNTIPMISNWDKKTKIIDKTISHISIERTWEEFENSNLTLGMDSLIKDEYLQISHRIFLFLEQLSDKNNINSSYVSDFEKRDIQQRFIKLKKLYAPYANL